MTTTGLHYDEALVTLTALAQGCHRSPADIDAALQAIRVYDAGRTAAFARLHQEAIETADVLRECLEYMDDHADADCDHVGYIPNEEMTLAMRIKEVLK